MTKSVIVVAVATTYLVACLVIGMWPSKRTSDSASGYVAGDRSLGPVVMYFITGATIFSAFAFLGAPGWAFSRGAAVFYILAFGTFGFLPFYFLGPRAARVGKRFGFVTQAEMVAHRFGRPSLAGVMALISALALIPYLAIQMKGAGYVLNAMTEGAVSREAGAAIVYGVVLAYVMKSGVLGVGWTNTFQGIVMMLLAWGMGLYLPDKLYGGVGPMFERIHAERPGFLDPPGTAGGKPWAWSEYSSAVVATVIGFSMWPQIFMKAFTARDEATLKRTVVLYPTFQLFLVPIILLGFAAVLFPFDATQLDQLAKAPDQVLPAMLMSVDVSPYVVGLFCAGALAASMSSGDAILHAAASILVRDGWVTALGRDVTPERERTLIRILLAVVVFVAYVLATRYEGTLVELLLYAYGPVTQFAPAVVATLCIRRATGAGVLAGLVSGIVVNLLFLWDPELRPFAIHAGLYGLGVNVIVLSLVSLVSSAARSSEFHDEFLAVASTSDRAPEGELQKN